MPNIGMGRDEADALAAEISRLGLNAEAREYYIPGHFEVLVTDADGRQSLFDDREGWRRATPRLLRQEASEPADDAYVYWPPRTVIGLVAGEANDIGSGEVQMYRNKHRGRGLDIVPIARLVVDVDGAEPTPLPSTATWAEVRVIEGGPRFRRLTCPLWTEAGRSSLELVVRMEPSPDIAGILDTYVEQVRDRDGRTLLEVSPDSRVEDPDWAPERWQEPVGHGGDSRIRRASFVGASAGILMGQLLRGMERALGDPEYHLDQLNDGQRAVFVLTRAVHEIYCGGLVSLYESWIGWIAPALPASAARVGADNYAFVFDRANTLFPDPFPPDADSRRHFLDEHADIRAQLEDLDRAFYELEDTACSIWEPMLRYIDAQPGEFFLPD